MRTRAPRRGSAPPDSRARTGRARSHGGGRATASGARRRVRSGSPRSTFSIQPLRVLEASAMQQLPLTYTLFTPAVVTSPKVCRDFVRSTLETHGLGELADTAALCTSELVTNVHQHVRGEVHLRATVEASGVRVAVYDGSVLPPCLEGRVGREAEGGRGLLLVASLADGFGVTPVKVGKGVWFQLNRG
ncbi:ATP-binding protein [Streptomyces sp. NPDC002845]